MGSAGVLDVHDQVQFKIIESKATRNWELLESFSISRSLLLLRRQSCTVYSCALQRSAYLRLSIRVSVASSSPFDTRNTISTSQSQQFLQPSTCTTIICTETSHARTSTRTRQDADGGRRGGAEVLVANDAVPSGRRKQPALVSPTRYLYAYTAHARRSHPVQ